jgi:hypothetical protein
MTDRKENGIGINISDPDVREGIEEALKVVDINPEDYEGASEAAVKTALALEVSSQVEAVEMQAEFIGRLALSNPDHALQTLAPGTADRKKMGDDAADYLIKLIKERQPNDTR